jgi:alpha-beta hydrolase superfamily lysophospholipase
MLQQLEDVLKVATESPDEPVPIFVGHSTGGALSILAAKSLERRKIRRLILVSPALWATKPLIARLADRAYDRMFSMLRCGFPGLAGAIKDGYLKNCDVAFAKERGAKVHRFEQQYLKALAFNRKMLEDHPHIVSGIAGITCYFLRDDLLARWRTELVHIATRQQADGTAMHKVCLIFGEEDVVVDYRSPFLAELKKHAAITVSPIAKQGHESLYEDSATVAAAALAFLVS